MDGAKIFLVSYREIWHKLSAEIDSLSLPALAVSKGFALMKLV